MNNIESYVENVQRAGEGMTLWQILQSGGVVMILLGILSIFMIALVIFLFLRLNVNRLVPQALTEKILEQIHAKKYREALQVCSASENIICNIASAGLSQVNHSEVAAQEAVEITARKEITSLWAPLGYLSDIAQIAPMLGLLGTVLGMIKAFNTIAFEGSVVKPILLAGGVSQAMVTTAAGLVVAIAGMIFYSLLRSRAQEITNSVEAAASELIEGFRK